MVSTRKAFELAVLCTDVRAGEAEAIGLANRAVPAEEWRATLDDTVEKLTRWYSRSMADGKRTFYAQAAMADLKAKYAVATPVMADMFQQETYAGKMRAFVDRKRK